MDNGNDMFQNVALVFGYASMFGLDISEVENFTIRRKYGDSAFELVMMDTIKE